MNDVAVIGATQRRRLPNRRIAVNETIEFAKADGSTASYEATVGFDEILRPKELFLFGAKEGTEMAAVLSDTAVAISVALQHGVSAQAMAVSLGRDPLLEKRPISVIGAALDLLVRHETPATAPLHDCQGELPDTDNSGDAA